MALKKIEKPTRKTCLACGKDMPTKNNFYASKNPLHKDGFTPWCKKCIDHYSLTEEKQIDEGKIKTVLRQLDKPYYKDVIQVAINQFKKESQTTPEDKIPFQGSRLIGLYFKNLNSLRQYWEKTYKDCEVNDFWFNKEKNQGDNNIYDYIVADGCMVNLDGKEIHMEDIDDTKYFSDIGEFKVTDEVKSLFGDGYSASEYKKMFTKYEALKVNYPLQTTLHQESLATYVRFKVKEENATARGEAKEAQEWYKAAQDAADKGKINPKSLSKDDLDSGVASISELVKTLEQATDVIKILPKFKYKPSDAPDFNIWCYINYERELSGQEPVSYPEIYQFYDKRKKEYIEQNGDPYGIFKDDPSESNRRKVKTFIKLPDDYDDMGGDAND